MLSVSFNICSDCNTVLNLTPNLWVIEDIRVFTDAIRENVLRIAHHGAHHNFSIKGIQLRVTVYEDLNKETYYEGDFVIKCKNIREYKKYLEMSNEDIINEYDALIRDGKIDDILE